jgi:replication factor A1
MSNEIRVADVRPSSQNFDLTVHVHSVGPVHEIADKSGMGRRPNRLVEAVVGDASGNVVMSLWNHEVDKVAAGDRLQVRGAYVKLVRGPVRVSVGRGGALEQAASEVVADPALPNISDARHEDDRPRAPRPPRFSDGARRSDRGDRFGDGERRPERAPRQPDW